MQTHKLDARHSNKQTDKQEVKRRKTTRHENQINLRIPTERQTLLSTANLAICFRVSLLGSVSIPDRCRLRLVICRWYIFRWGGDIPQKRPQRTLLLLVTQSLDHCSDRRFSWNGDLRFCGGPEPTNDATKSRVSYYIFLNQSNCVNRNYYARLTHKSTEDDGEAVKVNRIVPGYEPRHDIASCRQNLNSFDALPIAFLLCNQNPVHKNFRHK